MQKIDLKLLKTALKSIAFIVGATLFLMILHFTKAFTVAPSSWRFLLLLVGFFVVALATSRHFDKRSTEK